MSPSGCQRLSTQRDGFLCSTGCISMKRWPSLSEHILVEATHHSGKKMERLLFAKGVTPEEIWQAMVEAGWVKE